MKDITKMTSIIIIVLNIIISFTAKLLFITSLFKLLIISRSFTEKAENIVRYLVIFLKTLDLFNSRKNNIMNKIIKIINKIVIALYILISSGENKARLSVVIILLKNILG